ncbi:unnamed protein product, partial [marine sediment metagenome]
TIAPGFDSDNLSDSIYNVLTDHNFSIKEARLIVVVVLPTPPF